MSEENRGGFRAVIQTVCLIAIAVCIVLLTVLVWQDKKEENEAQASVLTGSEKEISLAGNTLYEQGVLSVMLDEALTDCQWNYFQSNTGKSVVEVSGSIFDIDLFIKALSSSRLDGNQKSSSGILIQEVNSITEIKTKSGIKNISVRIQFVKQLGVAMDTPYNNYKPSYSEYTVADSSGSENTYVEYPEEMLDVLEAYLQDSTL